MLTEYETSKDLEKEYYFHVKKTVLRDTSQDSQIKLFQTIMCWSKTFFTPTFDIEPKKRKAL